MEVKKTMSTDPTAHKRFLVSGVDRESHLETEKVIEASTLDHARAKAEAFGIIVVSAAEVSRPKAPASNKASVASKRSDGIIAIRHLRSYALWGLFATFLTMCAFIFLFPKLYDENSIFFAAFVTGILAAIAIAISSHIRLLCIDPKYHSKFKNPKNGYVVHVNTGSTFSYTFLFGCLYFASHRCWAHVVIGIGLIVGGVFILFAFPPGVLVVLTFWFLYGIAAPTVIRNHYRYEGWIAC